MTNKTQDPIKLTSSTSEAVPTGSESNGQFWRRDIVSHSAVMEACLQTARQAAETDSPILIHGRPGCGKKLLAHAIHRASRRADGPFIALHCADIPDALIESELFGEEQGESTITGKTSGLLHMAKGGTLYIAEIADIPPPVQSRFLQVLSRKDSQPGVSQTPGLNVRVVSATKLDLEDKVNKEEFLGELLTYVSKIALEVPTLEKRSEDIPFFVNHFREQMAEKHNKAINSFALDAMELLMHASWPGNVRQLLNVVEQCILLSPASVVSSKTLERVLRSPDKLLSLDKARARFERDYIVRILQLTEGNVAMAARLAERNRSEFYKILKRHGLKPARFRTRIR